MRIAYILLRFPELTETFIAQEIQSLLNRGIDVKIVSLLRPRGNTVQPLSERLLDRTAYAPGLLSLRLWAAQIHYLFQYSRLYAGLLMTLLRQPCRLSPIRSRLKRLAIFFKAVSAAHVLRNGNLRLLHAHFGWLSGAAAWVCGRFLDLPFTVTVHAFDLFSAKNDLLPLVTREADQIVAISEFNRRAVEALGTRPPGSISVVHCGIDTEQFSAPAAGPQAPSPGRGALRLISVGSLVAKKGHQVLIDACDILRRRGLSFSCQIIGRGSAAGALTAQIEASGLHDRVFLRGALPHPEIYEEYARSDIFVLACAVGPDGDQDGIPVALMEAGCMGLPLISTSISGIPELIHDQETGLLVPPANPLALADAIASLATDSPLRTLLGENAKALVQAEFNSVESSKRLATLFDRLIRRPSRDPDGP